MRCDSSRERRLELNHKLIDNSNKTQSLRKSMREAGNDQKAPKVKAKSTSLMRNLLKPEVKVKVKLAREVLKVKDQRALSQREAKVKVKLLLRKMEPRAKEVKVLNLLEARAKEHQKAKAARKQLKVKKSVVDQNPKDRKLREASRKKGKEGRVRRK